MHKDLSKILKTNYVGDESIPLGVQVLVVFNEDAYTNSSAIFSPIAVLIIASVFLPIHTSQLFNPHVLGQHRKRGVVLGGQAETRF